MKVIKKAENRRESSNQKEPKEEKNSDSVFFRLYILNINRIKSSKILQKSY